MKRILGAICAAALLGGCARTLRVTGNAEGGIVMHGGSNAAKAFEAADAHCSHFGKAARITGITYQDYTGDPVAFECITKR